MLKPTAFLLLLLGGFGCNKEQAFVQTKEALPTQIDYNFHIKPILADKCFACHGPDAAKQKAGLRLDTKDGATANLESGAGKAIVPGKPHKSQLISRILTEDPEKIMPPLDAHLELSPEEKAMLAAWIKEGADYKAHWSFIPLQETPIPKVGNADYIKNPIDHFILAKLEEKVMNFSPPASKETLIRRLSFDLRGLPPSLEEIDAFLADDSEKAIENLIDQFLESSAYGERMAANWMDVARYADSDGYLDDKHRNFSPWRDWVIKAFNENMPYDQFITWQLAGDLIPEANQESILATAFNRLHKKNSEAGIVFEEYRVEYVADRTNTLGKGILGLSLECARCHDHKYDPISQKDYYQLFGFFNSTFELGSPVYGPDITPGPALLLSSPIQQSALDSIKLMIEQLEAKQVKATSALQDFKEWSSKNAGIKTHLENSLAESKVAYYSLDEIQKTDREKVFLSPASSKKLKPASLVEPEVKAGVKGKAFFVNDYNSLKLGKDVGWFERTEPFSIQLWVYPDTLYPDVGVFWHCENLRLGLKGYSLYLKDNKLQFVMAHAWPQNAIQVTSQTRLKPKEWSRVSITYDGSSKAKGIHIFINGEEQELSYDFDHLYKGILFVPDIHTYGFTGFTMGARDKFIPFKKGGLDEISIYNQALSPLEILYSFDENAALQRLAQKNKEAEKLLHEYFVKRIDTANKDIKANLANARQSENDLLNAIPEIMVMGDLPEARKNYVLERGLYDALGEEIRPGTPASVLAYDESLPENRLGLAKWVFDKKNPLTARVYVNRIWQMHFGQGLVKTSEDFGGQGALPSHPELLDWLALYFMENDWDIKALHKLILSSASYQQSSVITPEKLEKDPENKWLSRGPRYRLPAEMIRDNVLAISGLLVHKLGGESVYPYQPAGLWDGLTTKHWAYRYLEEPGEGLYRRSLYTIWKRQAPPPSMQIFDMGDRSACSVRRTRSSTPLQALVLLNDPQFVEAARVMAEGLLREEKREEDYLWKAFRLITGRQPDRKEKAMIQEFYTQETKHFLQEPEKAKQYLENGYTKVDENLDRRKVAALAVLINTLLNTEEAYTKT